MSFEFEALVGHLYVVGGRAIRTAPPGTLVEVAPKKAARGREADTFIAMVLPSGDDKAPTAFYEQMAALAAQRYFDSTGSVTAGLRDVFHTLNNDLYEHNRSGKRRYETNLVCGVLKSDDLIVARVGCGAVVLQQDGQVQTFPEDLSDDEVLYIPPLGVQPMPTVKLKQFRVTPSTRVAIGDENLADFAQEQLYAAMQANDLGMVLVGLKELAKLQLNSMVIEFVPPESEVPPTVPEGQSTTEIAAKAREKPNGATNSEKPTRQKRPSVTKEAGRRTRRGLGQAALGIANVLKIIQRMIDHFFGPREGGKRRWFGSPLRDSAVILLPLVVVIMVTMLWLSRAGESEYEICITEAEDRAQLARSVANSERQTVLNAWDVTLEKVEECETLRPESQIMADLRAEARSVTDGLNDITRLRAQRLDSFEGARLTSLAIREGNLYTLDSANGIVYAIDLSEDGTAISSRGSILLNTGGQVDGFPIGEIIDIAYNDDDSVLVALDRNGVLVECSPRFGQCSAQRLLGVEDDWVNPVAMTVWEGRIYILDPGVEGGGQIWRYEPSGNGYGGAPTPAFSAVRPNITSAVDLGIDDRGHIYVLLSGGQVNKFLSGQPQPFDLVGFPIGQEIDSAASFFINDNPIAQSAFLVDQTNRAVYEVGFIGGYRDSYRVFNEDLFNLISAVVVAPGNTGSTLIYAASGNTVFVLEKQE